jgi:hypothetical protein
VAKAGDYSKSFITAVPADLSSAEALHFKKTILRFPGEAVYIYSFKENRMLYADGWKDILGYPDDEINMLTIVSCTSPEYAPFSHELNDKALQFMQSRNENLEAYSFTIELKKKSPQWHGCSTDNEGRCVQFGERPANSYYRPGTNQL